MLRVQLNTSEDGKSLILSLKGHAGQNDAGKDIICSASSILAYTLAQCVLDMYKDKKLRKKPTINLKSGDATIICKPLKAAYDEAAHLYYVAESGYRLLAHNYPDYVAINMFGKA